jgi:hypothetical protein
LPESVLSRHFGCITTCNIKRESHEWTAGELNFDSLLIIKLLLEDYIVGIERQVGHRREEECDLAKI